MGVVLAVAAATADAFVSAIAVAVATVCVVVAVADGCRVCCCNPVSLFNHHSSKLINHQQPSSYTNHNIV